MLRPPARRHRRTAVRVLLLGLLALAVARGARPDRYYTPLGDTTVDWPTADGVGGAHYSPLSDIGPDNVRDLEVAWVYRTGDVRPLSPDSAATAFEATPVVVDGVLYVATPLSRAVALDAETGAELWTFDPRIDRAGNEHGMTTSRGLSHWADPTRAPGEPCASRIFLAAFDARLFALDAATGRPCADFAGGRAIDLGEGVARLEGRRGDYMQSAPPTPVGDVVVLGSKIADGKEADAPSGVVRAYDARTGALRWAWEPLVGVGVRLPGGDTVAAGAANTWATITADPARDLIFVPTGSASPDHWGGHRPGDNRYANSLVALRGSTGEVVWHFQIVHHDLWDYDLPSPPALIDVVRDGRTVPAVVQSTKMGWLFVFHRETGEPLFPIVERSVPHSDVPGEVASPTQPVPLLPRALVPQGLGAEDAWGLTPIDRAACRRKIASMRSDGVYTPPSLEGSVAYPGFIGGMEWGGVAYDPGTGLLVTNTNRVATVATLVPREQEARRRRGGAPGGYLSPQARTPYAVRRDALLSPLRIPCNPPPWGMLHAVDMRTGAVVWERPFGSLRDLVKIPTPGRWGSPNLGGPLVSGGLVFIGATMDRRLRAYELATGELLWKAKLPASAQANPITYRARPGGRQYVVVAAGGHAEMRSALGDHVIAFALPAAPTGAEVRR